MPRFSLMFVAVALAAASIGVHAQWKWRDGKGQTHVSDLPPPREIPEKDVLQRPAAAAPRAAAATAPAAPVASAASAAPAAPRVDPELEARRKKAEQDQAAQRKVEEDKQAAARAENCENARANLRSLESGVRIARVNDKGEREIIDDKRRAEETQRARNVIASDCR